MLNYGTRFPDQQPDAAPETVCGSAKKKATLSSKVLLVSYSCDAAELNGAREQAGP